MAKHTLDPTRSTLADRMASAGRVPLGYRRDGSPIWPIFGAEDEPPPLVPPPPADPVVPDPPKFPPNTPLDQMTVEQREEYWKDKARKHEDRNKAFGKLTPEELADLRAKADKHDALELELGTEADKKAAEARKVAVAEADARYQPLLVQAKFEAAAAGRLEPDKLATILEPLDLSKFLAPDGTPDTDKVRAYVDGIAPVMGTPPPRTGPSSNGMGNRGKSTPGSGSVAAGRDLYAETHPKK